MNEKQIQNLKKTQNTPSNKIINNSIGIVVSEKRADDSQKRTTNKHEKL